MTVIYTLGVAALGFLLLAAIVDVLDDNDWGGP